MAITGEAFGTPSKDPVVLMLNKLTRHKIGLTLAISTNTTKRIIEEAIKRWGVKLFLDNVTICSKPNPLAPKTPTGRRNLPPLTT
jgi:FMN phosphatase YigB (HAD superfamily)